MVCKNCGKKNDKNNKFCISCGKKLKEEETKEIVKQNNEEKVDKVVSNTKENQTNIWAIIGFIVSLLLSGILGLILSIVGLVESKKVNSGKGLSIAGIVISSLRIIFTIILIIVAIMFVLKGTNSFFNSLINVISDDYSEVKNSTNLNLLDYDEVIYNGVTLSFPATEQDLKKAGLTIDEKYADINVTPGGVMIAGHIGNENGGAEIEVTNTSDYTKTVKDCEIYKITFTNPKDQSENVVFASNINYSSTIDEVKSYMSIEFDDYIATTESGMTTIKYTDDDDEYISFSFENNVLSKVTIQVDVD